MKRAVSIMSLIILVALLLRVVGLGWGLPNEAHIHSYHPDEQTTLRSLRGMDPAKGDFIDEMYILPDFYFYVVGITVGIVSFFKYVTLTKSEPFYFQHPKQWARIYFIGRLLSVLFGILSVFFIYLCGKELFNEKVGTLSAFLLAILPTHVVHSHYTTVNAMFVFLVVLCLWLAAKVIKEGKFKWYILFGIFAGFATSAKYTGILLVFPIVGAHLLNQNDEFNIKNIVVSLFSKKLALSLMLLIIFIFVSSPYLLIHFPLYWANRNSRGLMTTFTGVSEGYFKNFFSPIGVYFWGMGLLMLIVSIIGVLTAFIKRGRSNILLLFWVIPFYLVSVQASTGGYGTSSRFLPMMPFFVILSANLVTRLHKIIQDFSHRNSQNLTERKSSLSLYRFLCPSGAKKIILPLLIGIISIPTLIYTIALDLRFVGSQPQQMASDWIETNVPDDATIGLYGDPRWYSPNIIFREYWQFKNKGNYKRKYNYKFVTCKDYESMIANKPDFVIIPYDAYEYKYIITHIPVALKQMFTSDKYSLARVFEKKVILLGKRGNLETGDLLYNPTIYIFKREG